MKLRLLLLLIFPLLALSACTVSGHIASGASAPASSPPPIDRITTPAPPASETLAQQEIDWINGPAGQSLQTLVSDFKAVSTDASSVAGGDFSSIQADCQQMSDDAKAALTAPPNPDPKTAQDLAAAFAGYANSGALCANGAAQGNVGMLTAANTEITQATAYVVAADNRIKQLGG